MTYPLPSRASRALNHALTHGGGRLAGTVQALFAPAPAAGPYSLGVQPSPDDARDYPFVWSGRPPLAEMDYRGECAPVKNQGAAGACTAFQACGHAERLLKRAGRLKTLSELGNYAMSRQYLGLIGDSGASLRASLKVGQKYGIASEDVYPYDLTKLNTLTLPDAVMADAATRKFDAYYRIDQSLTNESALNRRIDAALADGYTVGIGIWLYRWFFYVSGPLPGQFAYRSTGVAANYGVDPDHWWDIIGAHAMVIVGRSDSMGGYVVRNSWGATWGDAGYYLLPFADTSLAFEFWAVAGFNGADVAPAPYDKDSAEAKAARLYRAAFGRCADAPGLAYQAHAVDTLGLETVATQFMASPEFATRYGAPTDAAFVTALYRNALGREPDPDGFAYQLHALSAGTTRAQMLANFSESPENRNP